MKILALDTSAGYACAALLEDDRLIFEARDLSGHAHSVTLLPMIESMMRAHGLKTGDIDLFAVSAGPGSYTGLRIGISTAMGLAQGRGRCCMAVSSLEALAMNLADSDGLICPVIDARRDRMYTALFVSEGGALKRCAKDELTTLTEIDRRLESLGAVVRLTGDGYEKSLAALTYGKIKKTPPLLRQASAYAVGLTAYGKLSDKKEEVVEAGMLRPVYLNAVQAERERLERLEKEKGSDEA